LHLRLFFALCRDITDMTIHQSFVPSDQLLELFTDYANAEHGTLPDHTI
jgi:hypothetical protein